jgi:hypothetical protein
VFVAVERAPLEAEIEETPYESYSPDYTVATPHLDKADEELVKGRRAHGLAGQRRAARTACV